MKRVVGTCRTEVLFCANRRSWTRMPDRQRIHRNPAKEARHDSQMGRREAWVSSSSHSRQPAGKKMLASASAAPASQTGIRNDSEEEAFATDFPTAEAYSLSINNQ